MLPKLLSRMYPTRRNIFILLIKEIRHEETIFYRCNSVGSHRFLWCCAQSDEQRTEKVIPTSPQVSMLLRRQVKPPK